MSKANTISNEAAIATIVDVLRLRAETQRDEIAYRFLADGEEERFTLTYGELYSRARRVAAEFAETVSGRPKSLLLDSSEAPSAAIDGNQYDWRDSSSVSRYSMQQSSAPWSPQA